MRVHRDAIIADLETRLAGSVFTSYDAIDKSRYAVVFIGRAAKVRSRFASGQVRDVFTVTVHSVGESEEACLWVEDRVNLLTGKTLFVPDRRLFPVEYITGQPPALNDNSTKPLWFTVSQFDIISDPA